MSDILILKANILGGMNEYIHEIGDEDVLNDWYAYGIPDGCTEEMLMDFAGDERIFMNIVDVFNSILVDINGVNY